MKYLFGLLSAGALCWLILSQLRQPAAIPAPITLPSPVAKVAAPPPLAAPPPQPSPVVIAPAAPSPEPTPVTAASATVLRSATSSPSSSLPPGIVNEGPLPFGTKPWDNRSPFIEPTKPAGPPPPLPQIVLTEVLGPDNLYHDDAMGISVTYPPGWRIPGANRWGVNNSENTVPLSPDITTTARPSMYYQKYPNGYPELEGTTAYFQRVAQNKENQRIAGGMTDYKNVPSSFEFTEINGNPTLTYFAVHTRGEEVQTEFFIRILGKKSYVTISTPGRVEDVQAIMPQLKQMAQTVKVP